MLPSSQNSYIRVLIPQFADTALHGKWVDIVPSIRKSG